MTAPGFPEVDSDVEIKRIPWDLSQILQLINWEIFAKLPEIFDSPQI